MTNNSPKHFLETVELKSDLRQRDLEDFYKEMRKLEDSSKGDKISIPEFSGNSVRAAIKLGWFSKIDSTDVDNMHPGVVQQLQIKITSLISEALTISPN
jgi:hypothetical protein